MIDLWGNKVSESLWVIEGEYCKRGIGNSFFHATIVEEGHPDAVEYKPLMKFGVKWPDYYVCAEGKYLSMKFGRTTQFPRISDYTKKQYPSKGATDYLHALKFSMAHPHAVAEQLMPGYKFTSQSNSQQGKLKKNVNIGVSYHRGVKETFHPLDDGYYSELGIPKEEWEAAPTMAKLIKEMVFVDHIDTCTNNNNITNLRYTTPRGNNPYVKYHQGITDVKPKIPYEDGKKYKRLDS